MSDTTVEQVFYTPAEVAKLVGVSKLSVYNRVKAGKIQYVRAGKLISITKDGVAEWVAKRAAAQAKKVQLTSDGVVDTNNGAIQEVAA